MYFVRNRLNCGRCFQQPEEAPRMSRKDGCILHRDDCGLGNQWYYENVGRLQGQVLPNSTSHYCIGMAMENWGKYLYCALAINEGPVLPEH